MAFAGVLDVAKRAMTAANGAQVARPSLARKRFSRTMGSFRLSGFTKRLGNRLLDGRSRAFRLLLGLEPARDRAAQIEIGVGSALDVVRCDAGDCLRPLLDGGHGTADGDAPAVAAGEARLVVALVDVICEQRFLGA